MYEMFKFELHYPGNLVCHSVIGSAAVSVAGIVFVASRQLSNQQQQRPGSITPSGAKNTAPGLSESSGPFLPRLF
jgi:hypothetical protein